jgi:glycosyltransferase involved in cell wall biosynthesis
VVVTSATTGEILVRDYGVRRELLTVAPPGTDAAERAAGSGGPGVAVLSVGSLTRRKGHDALIAALEGLKGLDWRLTVAGPTHLDPAHAAELRRQVEAAGLDGRVDFVGSLAPGELDRAYAEADLFVLASRYEGFGMVYTEAMARGLPVVGCDAGAVAEATRAAARLVPPGDVAALRAALAELIGDGAARRRLADACWRAAQGFARWSDTAAQVAGALREAKG